MNNARRVTWGLLAAGLMVAPACVDKHVGHAPIQASQTEPVAEPANEVVDQTAFKRPPLSLLKSVKGPFDSTGHIPGRWAITVFTTDPPTYLEKKAATVGFIVCAEHREKPAGERGPLACMRKEPPGYASDDGDTRYAIGAPSEAGWLREGKLPDCIECHSAAPNDHRFGP